MRAKLELKAVGKRFDDLEAVKGLSIALVKGEFVSLLGPSGCGKSTTLAMIAGFLAPDAGEILVDGKVINRLPPQRRKIGLVFQDYAVFSKLSVRRNLSFGLEAQHLPRAERGPLVESFAAQLGLSAILDNRGDSLNMSEMQRVALARVLITKPQLLLLDEPMSNLDASLRASLRGELKQIQKALDQTVFYVTHDQIEAMSMSDRIAVMRAGELLQVGTPEEIYHHPVNRFVAEFIGDPPINVVACQVSRSGDAVVASTLLHERMPLGRGAIESGNHWLAIRPHSFAVSREPDANGVATTVRFVENFGAEHVLHVDYGAKLARVVAAPGFAGIGDGVYLSIDPRRVHLIERGSEAVVQMEAIGAAA